MAAGTASAALIEGDQLSWDAHDNFDLDRVAYPGMFIDTTGTMGTDPVTGLKWIGKMCTLGAVGTDSTGRKIGITAGHCNNEGATAGNIVDLGDGTQGVVKNSGVPTAQLDTELTANAYPIFDRNAEKRAKESNPQNPVAVDPIGWIRWVDHQEGDNGDTTDYMVIEFAPDVELRSQVYGVTGAAVMSTKSGGGPFKVNSIYTDATGKLALPPLGTALSPKEIEHFGAMSAREPGWGAQNLSVYYAEAPNHGNVNQLDNPGTGLFRAAAAHQPGDSGGPVVIRGTSKWVGIITGYGPPANTVLQSQWIFTSAKNILEDLNQPNTGRTYGVGFTPINN